MSDKLEINSQLKNIRKLGIKEQRKKLAKKKKIHSQKQLKKILDEVRSLDDKAPQPGFYLIRKGNNLDVKHLNTLKNVKKELEKADNYEQITEGKFKKTLEGLKIVAGTCAKLKCSPAEVMAYFDVHSEVGIEYKLSKNIDASVIEATKAYAKCGASLLETFVEVGLTGDVTATVEGKVLKYEAKIYAEAKGGVRVNWFGASAFAAAEVGAKHTCTLKLPEYKGLSIQPFITMKAFAKAEAKITASLTGFGANAFAGVGAAVIGGASFVSDPNSENKTLMGAIEFAGEITFGVGAGAKWGLDLKKIEEKEKKSAPSKKGAMDGRGEQQSFTFSVEGQLPGGPGAGISANYTISGTIKLNKKIGDAIVKGIIERVIKKVVSKEVWKDIIKIKEEIEAWHMMSLDKKETNKRNLFNYSQKLWIGLAKGVGKNKLALEKDISRNLKKLEMYRKDTQKQIDVLNTEKTLTPKQIKKLIEGVTDKTLSEELRKSATGHRKLLIKYVEKYDRRIEKMNVFLNDEISSHYKKIKNKTDYISAALEKIKPNEYSGLTVITEEEKKNIIKKINNDIDSINGLVEEFNLIVTTKKALSNKSNKLIASDKDLELDDKNMPELIQKQHDKLETDIKKVVDLIKKYRKLLE